MLIELRGFASAKGSIHFFDIVVCCRLKEQYSTGDCTFAIKRLHDMRMCI
jgi:hypothetical protein